MVVNKCLLNKVKTNSYFSFLGRRGTNGLESLANTIIKNSNHHFYWELIVSSPSHSVWMLWWKITDWLTEFILIHLTTNINLEGTVRYFYSLSKRILNWLWISSFLFVSSISTFPTLFLFYLIKDFIADCYLFLPENTEAAFNNGTKDYSM